MKNLYSIIGLFMLLTSVSLYGQNRVYAPSLTLPENSETGLSPNLVLDWDAVTGETLTILYELQLSTNSEFIDAVTFPKTDITAKEMVNLLFGTTYHWRVKAYDGEEVSDWSEVWTFTIASSIEMLKPDEGEMVYAKQSITWKEITGLMQYQIQIDTSYTWNSVNLETSEDILSSFIIDENNMWMAGTSGLMLHFDGNTWETVDAGTTEDLTDICFTEENIGYAIGDNSTFLKYDGFNWSAITTDIDGNYSGFVFFDTDNGYIVGENGLVIKYTSGSFAQEYVYDGNDTLNKDLTDVEYIDINNYWLCGKNKYIAKYDGNSWIAEEIGSKDHYSIWFTDENNGWVASKGGKLQHYNGSEWSEITTDADDLYSISFDGTKGCAVGKDGSMVVYNGNEWAKTTSGDSKTLNTIYLKDGHGIAAGDAGTLINNVGEGFDSPYSKTFNISSDSTSYYLNNLLFDKKMYYRMRGMHSLDTSAWSGSKSMTSYPYPEPGSPSNNSDDVQLKIVFEWEEFSGVTRYYLSVSPNEDFSPVYNYPSDSNSFQLNDFEFGEQYYWRVKAEHSEDISNWSDAYSFTTINTVTLVSPDNNAADVNKCPRFEWEEILGATAYELWVDPDENFTNPESFITSDYFQQCQGVMQGGTTYFWKVRGIAGLDTSNWSPDWSFKVESVGINEMFNEESLSIYPNPSKGEFTLDINSADAANYVISVIDMVGRTIYTNEFNCSVGNNKIEINLSGTTTSGTYMINVSRNNITVNKRLFIK